MKRKLYFISSILIFFIQFSCMESVKREIGSCYIQEGEDIKYLNRLPSGNIDTIILKDANVAFFEIVSDENPENECVSGNTWSKDRMNVWYKDKIIIGANPESFQVLGNGYSKDKKYAYFHEQLLNGADLHTFKILNHFFALDSGNIWYSGKEVFGIEDPSTFELIDSYFSRDKGHIYFNNDTILMLIPDSDPQSFKSFKFEEEESINAVKYYIDKDHVYFIDTDKKISDKDFIYVFDAFTSSFEVLSDRYYSKDNFNVYYKNKIIPNVNPFKFTVLGNNYSKDDTYIYFKYKKMFGVDYQDFRVFSDTSGFDARDSKSYFLKGKRIKQLN